MRTPRPIRFPTIATSSAAMAWSLGYADGEAVVSTHCPFRSHRSCGSCLTDLARVGVARVSIGSAPMRRTLFVFAEANALFS